MIDGRYAFDKPIRNSKKTQENIAKTATGQGDDYDDWLSFRLVLFPKPL